MSVPACPRLSEYFHLDATQHNLSFVDILPDADLPLYLDPYAFKVGTDDLAAECNNLVVDFFETVLDCIRRGRHTRGTSLLNQLHEPNEYCLGVSSGQPRGRGIGREQAGKLFGRLAASKAATSGLLRDLSDCELLIPHISSDKVSDITGNIVRGAFARFTEQQCRKYRIPMKRVGRGIAWSEEHHDWVNDYASLPLYKDKPVILVPRTSVRRQLTADHQEYHRDYVLAFLQQEQLNAGTSLVETLKNGKRRVTKKAVLKLCPGDKESLSQFTEAHPEVLRKYRAYLSTKYGVINPSELEKLINQVRMLHGGLFSPPFVNVEVTVGDKNINQGTVVGGVVGSGSVNARDINAFNEAIAKSDLDAETKQALTAARQAAEALNAVDKADVSDSLGRLASELDKPEPQPSLVRRYTERVKGVAATAWSALMAAKTIKELVEAAT